LASAFAGFDAALVVNVANGYFLPALKLSGVPSAINTDGIEWERGKWGTVARRVFRLGAKAAARYADVTIADSREIARIWKVEFGVDSEFIPYGAPVLETVADDRVVDLGLEPDGYSLVVARLVPENNVDLALDALAGRDVPLVVVGSGTGGTPLEERLAAMSGRGEVRWLGHISDQDLLKQLWAHASIYFHGHSVGGTNPALLQALGAGAPTIALDTPFNREVIGNDTQLFPNNADKVLALATRIKSDPDLRAEWRRRGRSTVAARYSWEDVSNQYLEALNLARRRKA
jgi:glycosyltransferase involved in cell wall biosynthesis